MYGWLSRWNSIASSVGNPGSDPVGLLIGGCYCPSLRVSRSLDTRKPYNEGVKGMDRPYRVKLWPYIYAISCTICIMHFIPCIDILKRIVLHDNIEFWNLLSNLWVCCIYNCVPCVLYSESRGLTLALFPHVKYVCFTIGQSLDDKPFIFESFGGFGQDGVWGVRPWHVIIYCLSVKDIMISS